MRRDPSVVDAVVGCFPRFAIGPAHTMLLNVLTVPSTVY